MAAAAKKLEHVYSPLQAEALAARDGLLLATYRGLQNFIVESDPLQIVAAFRNPSTCMSVIGHIIEDSMALIASVTGASSSHVRRQANGIAHRQARTGLLSGTNCNWERVPPDLISDL